MSSIVVAGDTSGSVTLSAPAVAGTTTLTLPSVSGTVLTSATGQTLTSPTITSPTISGAVISAMASSILISGTAVASTSGTSIDFTSIPSWAKRITVMFNGVSTSGTSPVQIQLGNGTIVTTGYVSGNGAITSTTGFLSCTNFSAPTNLSGSAVSTTLGSNVWVNSSVIGASGGNVTLPGTGYITLAGALDRLRITTVNGTDTFDAGSINILYE